MSDMPPPPSRPLPPSSMGDLPGQVPGTGFRPLGGSPLPEGPAMLQTLNGIVTNMQTVVMETQKVAKDITASSERSARMLGDAFDKAATAGFGRDLPPWQAWAQSGAIGLPNVSSPRVAPAHTTSSRGGGGGGGNDPIPANVVDSHQRAAAHSGFGERRYSGPPLPPGFQLPGTWDEGRQFDLGSLRQNIARSVNRGVSQWGNAGQQQLRDQYGRFAGTRPAPAGSKPEVSVVRKYDAAGNLVRDEAGKGIIEEVGSGGWKYEGSAMVRNVAGSLAEGEGLGSAISSAAPAVGKALGVAGAVYMGTNAALDFAESQRQKNLEFQSVLGGSNAEGFSERMRQNVFRLGLRGTMGGADAEAIYKAGLENYGTNRGMRNNYQDAAVSMYRGGIGTDESIQLLNLAAKNGNDNIRELADSVIQLGHTAREAGVSAKEARDHFAEAMTGLSGTASGTNQIQTAAVEATVRTNLGARFNDVNFSGQDSELGQRRIAQMLGISYSSLNASLNSGSVRVALPGRAGTHSGTEALAVGKDMMMNRAVQMADPTGQLRAAVMEKVNRLDDPSNPTAGQLEEIAAQVQQENPQLADPMRISGILTSVGGASGVTDSNAMAFFVRQGTNQRQNEDAYKESTKGVQFNVKPGMERGDGFKRIADPSKLRGDYRAAYNFVEEELGYNLADNDQQRQFARGKVDEGKGRPGNRRSTSDQFRNALVNRVSQGKEITAGMMQLYEARDDLSDSRFVVQTKGGEERSVEYGELVRYYADQIKANPDTIKIQGGRYAGMDLYQAFGIAPTGGKARTAGVEAQHGVSVDEGAKKVKDKGGKGDGKVEIYLTDEARRLIGINASGSAQEARAAGVQPPSNASTPPETRGN